MHQVLIRRDTRYTLSFSMPPSLPESDHIIDYRSRATCQGVCVVFIYFKSHLWLVHPRQGHGQPP